MREYLLFQLYGPMAAWGDVAVGEYRPTQAAVSKSGIIGLLGAALGIRRDDAPAQNSLAQGYAFACRLERAGQNLRDYHTIETPPTRKGVDYHTRRDQLTWLPDALNTIISQRDYRLDYACTVAVWGRGGPTDTLAPYPLADLAQALQQPHFTLYLGRKSCPLAWPLLPQVLRRESLAEAFAQIPYWYQRFAAECPGAGAAENTETEPLFYWEDDALTEGESGLEKLQAHTRRDVPLNRRRWQFTERQEMVGGRFGIAGRPGEGD